MIIVIIVIIIIIIIIIIKCARESEGAESEPRVERPGGSSASTIFGLNMVQFDSK